eukprot:TRINITY_DN40571_c0_g1_i2.p1 TRINITY_DN40571_c0_g1~~TRINITY_DN40571_c0_g1_i2.p1  ORF type:complete len:407 (-),score=44.67 TRINITY_DN40571_c0_g1_i2:96-1316(-)
MPPWGRRQLFAWSSVTPSPAVIVTTVAATSAVGLPLLPVTESTRLTKSKFFVLEPPEELVAPPAVGFPLQCQEFGHMYSFETYFIDFLRENTGTLAASADEADYVVLPHCATYVYHMYRYRFGYGETVKGCWEAFDLVQERYLLPLIAWAKTLPAHERNDGKNFLIVFSLDKGRVDYPLASAATSSWRALTTVGNGSAWLAAQQPYLLRHWAGGDDRCVGTVERLRRFVWHSRDVVLPVPTTFSWTDRSSESRRPTLLFYAGTPNSCLRRFICESYVNFTDVSVKVVDHAIPRGEFTEAMYRSRFCLVPDGFSAISARLYEVMAHGCVPVIISEAFHPPFERIVDWTRFALFVRPREVPLVHQILGEVSDDHYLALHSNLQGVAPLFDMSGRHFWAAALLAITGDA